MDDIFFEISSKQKKLESSRELQSYMKGISALIVLLIFFGSLSDSETMKIAWLLTLPILCVLFGFNVYFIKKSKQYEFEIFELKKEFAKNKEELARAKGELLTEPQLNDLPQAPSADISLPIVYYVVMLILDILVKVFMIH